MRSLGRSTCASWMGRVARIAVLAMLATPAHADSWNVSLIGGHEYDHVEDDVLRAGNQESLLPEISEHRSRVGAAATYQFFRALGARAIVTGVFAESETDGPGGFDGTTIDREGVDVTAMLFLRNPDFGHLDLGYRFERDEFSKGALDTQTSHGAVLEAGLYVPDEGMGFVDWDVTAAYANVEQDFGAEDATIDEYEVRGGFGYYVGPSVRIGAGVLWNLRDAEAGNEREDLRGTAEIAWLLPVEIAGRRFATVDLAGSYGRVKTDVGGPFSKAEQSAWSTGVGLSFDFPGATSIMELIRERR